MDAFTGTRARWALLGAGTFVSLVAAHGRWEVAGAAWIYLILL
ncbi:hypothetical protein ACTMTI_51110 [Nonomuraea sp. H19]